MNLFNIYLIVISVLLTTVILLQQSNSGNSGLFGGGESGTYYAKRGVEKWLFFATILLSILFVGGAFVRLLI